MSNPPILADGNPDEEKVGAFGVGEYSVILLLVSIAYRLQLLLCRVLQRLWSNSGTYREIRESIDGF